MSEPTSRPSQRSAHCGRRRAPRIDHEQARAVVDALEQVVEEDRVRLAGVRAPEQDRRRSPRSRWYDDVPPPAPNTVARPTTLGACQVRLQRVDVVRAHHLARELLRQEVHLVRRLRAREDPERRRGVGGTGTREAVRRAIERLVPATRGEVRRPSRTSGVVRRPAVAATSGFGMSAPSSGRSHALKIAGARRHVKVTRPTR